MWTTRQHDTGVRAMLDVVRASTTPPHGASGIERHLYSSMTREGAHPANGLRTSQPDLVILEATFDEEMSGERLDARQEMQQNFIETEGQSGSSIAATNVPAGVISDIITSRIESDSRDHFAMDAQRPTPDEAKKGISRAVDLAHQRARASSASPSVSTTFHLEAEVVSSLRPDTALLSSDGTLFHVHRGILTGASSNSFGTLLLSEPTTPNGTFISVPEDAAVLNIVLHAIYGLPSAQFSPSFDVLSTALERMSKYYGLDTTRYVSSSPPTDLFNQLYANIPHRPMDVYMLAASLFLEQLAVLSSAHLLSFRLNTLTDEMVDRMGARYLRRLVFLHLDRMRSLKEALLMRAPPGHEGCGLGSGVQGAWALATAGIVQDARPDLSPHLLVAMMKRYGDKLACTTCRNNFRDTLSEAAAQWSTVKATI